MSHGSLGKSPATLATNETCSMGSREGNPELMIEQRPILCDVFSKQKDFQLKVLVLIKRVNRVEKFSYLRSSGGIQNKS